MPAPQEVVPGCPPGLEYLTQIDQLLVNQQIELLEGTFRFNHMYRIYMIILLHNNSYCVIIELLYTVMIVSLNLVSIGS